MRYQKIQKADIANNCGHGWGTTLFVQGCNHNCKGCFNKQTWNKEGGKLFDEAAKKKLFNTFDDDHCDSITFSGGDPLFVDNRATIIALSQEIRNKYPKLKQILYTGYTIEEVGADPTMSPILQTIDIIVDGEFKEELKDNTLPYCGSSNQRVIEIKEE